MIAVTVIVPFYNVEPYIADCLQSVMRQTYRGPLECILVDDCGSDSSVEIAAQMIAAYEGPIEFKILHHENNRGLSAARNTGLDAANGEYVCFLDSDDWISDDCIEKLANPLQEEKFDIVVGDYEAVGCFPGCKLTLGEGRYFTKPFDSTFCNQGVYVMAWNKLYSKHFLDRNKLRFEEGRIHEDEIWVFELSCVDKSFFVVKSVTYFYRIRENSITHQTDTYKKLDGRLGVLNYVKDKVKQYRQIDGVFDYYLFWVNRYYKWISKIEMDEVMLAYVDKETSRFLEVIPNMRCLSNKHNRLAYWCCRKNQTYSRYQYVTQVYSNRLQGRIMRNLLNLLPTRHS